MRLCRILLCLSVISVPLSTARAQQLIPLVVDYAPAPTSLQEAGKQVDLVAVVEFVRTKPQPDLDARPTTEFTARIIDVVKGRGQVTPNTEISIVRDGGLRRHNGAILKQEQLGFPLWKVGQTAIVFLDWSESHRLYYPAFGPDFTFDRDEDGTVAAHGRGNVAKSNRGKPFEEVLARVKAAVR